MQSFAYHRSVAPMLWVLVGLVSIELVIDHFLLAMWRPSVAVVLSVATLAVIGWLVAGIRSFRRLPVTLDGEVLVMRVGTLKQVAIPVKDVAGLREHWDAAFLKRRTTLNLALIAYPNIVIDLATPSTLGRRSIEAVARRLDDRAAFVAAMERLGGRHD